MKGKSISRVTFVLKLIKFRETKGEFFFFNSKKKFGFLKDSFRFIPVDEAKTEF